MKQTWRWFGPNDPIPIEALPQIGVEGVVTALHHIQPGKVWPLEEIRQRQRDIEFFKDGKKSGLSWEVVESLPVSEAIKTRSGDYLNHIEAYKQSLVHLAESGLKTVCYNFMPVLDWTRTSLRAKQPHGGFAMEFDVVDFAIFDLYILKREDAHADYDRNIIEIADKRYQSMSLNEQDTLKQNIIAGLPGSNDKWSLKDVRKLLNIYQQIDAKKLRDNFVAFLQDVIPLSAELDINLCCHPDDPPFPLMGLPRIMSTSEDYAYILEAVDMPQNGITLCTGSLGVSPQFNFTRFIDEWGHRIHFVHLRNTIRREPKCSSMQSFFEAEHLGGDTNMVAVIQALLDEESTRRKSGRSDWQIPMRPDHGQEILDDIDRVSMPGYPLIGRTRGLAELRGVMDALEQI